MDTHTNSQRRGFTLVELLVVIGIIAVLISILLPSLAKAREQANLVKCMSNLRQVSMAMLLYANDNHNYLWPGETPGWDWNNNQNTNPASTTVDSKNPPGDSQATRIPELWTNAIWGKPNPPELMCPNDDGMVPDNFDPRIWHSFMLNGHLTEAEKDPNDPSRTIYRKFNRFGLDSGGLRGAAAQTVIVMGEKKLSECDYNLAGSEYAEGKVDEYKHGIRRGSNYLYLDLHVSTDLPPTVRVDPNDPTRKGVDPWDLLPE